MDKGQKAVTIAHLTDMLDELKNGIRSGPKLLVINVHNATHSMVMKK